MNQPAGLRSKATLDTAIRRHGRTVLVVNTRSRRGRRLYPTIRGRLAELGLDLLDAFPVTDPRLLHETFAKALALRPDLVVVGGGDGTQCAAAGHLAHRDVALGVLPLGTTNNFARSIRVPVATESALEVISRGKVADIDLGRVSADPRTSMLYVNMVSLGMSVEVAAHVPHELKRVLGRAAYALTALLLLPSQHPFQVRLRIVGGAAGGNARIDARIDAGTREFRTRQLNIANGAYHSGRPIARDASADDRLLAVYRLGDSGRRHLAGAMLRHVLTGHRRTLTDDLFLTARELIVETDPPLPIDVDGEVRGTTPVRISLLPNALRVMVSPDFHDK